MFDSYILFRSLELVRSLVSYFVGSALLTAWVVPSRQWLMVNWRRDSVGVILAMSLVREISHSRGCAKFCSIVHRSTTFIALPCCPISKCQKWVRHRASLVVYLKRQLLFDSICECNSGIVRSLFGHSEQFDLYLISFFSPYLDSIWSLDCRREWTKARIFRYRARYFSVR